MAKRTRRRQWLEFAAMAGGGLLFAVAGLVAGIRASGADRGPFLTAAAFGCALLAVSPLFRPGGGRDRLRLDAVHVQDREERGVRFPYAGWATVCVLISAGFFTLACAGLVAYGDTFGRAPHRHAWAAQLVGVVGVVFFGGGSALLALRGVGRPWRVVLLPSGVLAQRGAVRTFLPWQALEDVRLHWIRAPYGAREPVVTLGDLSIPVRALDVESSLLPRVVRYYQEHPEARAELATEAGLHRIRSGNLR